MRFGLSLILAVVAVGIVLATCRGARGIGYWYLGIGLLFCLHPVLQLVGMIANSYASVVTIPAGVIFRGSRALPFCFVGRTNGLFH